MNTQFGTNGWELLPPAHAAAGTYRLARTVHYFTRRNTVGPSSPGPPCLPHRTSPDPSTRAGGFGRRLHLFLGPPYLLASPLPRGRRRFLLGEARILGGQQRRDDRGGEAGR